MDSSIHQCFCSAIGDSQQPVSPIGFLFFETSATALCGTTGNDYVSTYATLAPLQFLLTRGICWLPLRNWLTQAYATQGFACTNLLWHNSFNSHKGRFWNMLQRSVLSQTSFTAYWGCGRSLLDLVWGAAWTFFVPKEYWRCRAWRRNLSSRQLTFVLCFGFASFSQNKRAESEHSLFGRAECRANIPNLRLFTWPSMVHRRRNGNQMKSSGSKGRVWTSTSIQVLLVPPGFFHCLERGRIVFAHLWFMSLDWTSMPGGRSRTWKPKSQSLAKSGLIELEMRYYWNQPMKWPN